MKKQKIRKVKKIKEETQSAKLPDNIDEYFARVDGTKEAYHSRELFTADKNVDLKTDLGKEEIVYINVLMYNDDILKSKGLKPVFNNFLNKYMRLKFSLDRKSRGEFVNINKTDKTDDVLGKMADLKNISDTKK